MGLEHPSITRVIRTGYPKKDPEPIGEDVFGNTIWEGDKIAIFEGNVMLWDELPLEAKAILEMANVTPEKV